MYPHSKVNMSLNLYLFPGLPGNTPDDGINEKSAHGALDATGLFSAALCLSERAEDPITVKGALSSMAALLLSRPGKRPGLPPREEGLCSSRGAGPSSFST